ncbi:hypothetical protein BUZ78_11380 [Staphylococcus saprophyticus]|nr:hypothetical protein BUZ78_11380 [Staphylococcus saprophyticus]RIM28782.1 hypothetical protein BUY22_17625 [Staphylococcus cohnii]RIO32112.1 hypothetical protein BUZ79_09365 [Staphylococcus saprophyticus]
MCFKRNLERQAKNKYGKILKDISEIDLMKSVLKISENQLQSQIEFIPSLSDFDFRRISP